LAPLIFVWNAFFVAGHDDTAGFHHTALFGDFMPLVKLPTWSSSSLCFCSSFGAIQILKRWDKGCKAWWQIINSSHTAARLGTQ
jgi:hypothetical protein